MDLGMESHVWALAQQVLGDPGFTSIVDKLVGEYKRRPGIDVTERLHASDIGEHAIAVLGASLKRHGIVTGGSNGPYGYVAVRSKMRHHLHARLQWHLMQADAASEMILEELLARDLNL